jgi:ComEC/Rec2-related protein
MGLFPALMARGYANKMAAAAAALAATAYASIAGGHVSTIRALLMVLAYAVAILIDRSRELLASVALAALIICFALPGSTADIGFQLSLCVQRRLARSAGMHSRQGKSQKPCSLDGREEGNQ